jgi:hypothetical protein
VRGVDQSEAVKFERNYLGYKNILKKKLFLQISAAPGFIFYR